MINQQQNLDFLTLFENLLNEFFIEIFSYLTTIDTFIAFSIFNFTSINKTKFNIIFQYNHTNQWHLLKLSDDNNTTSGQVKYFFDNYSLINNFSQLETIEYTITNFCSYNKILICLKTLKNLKIIFFDDKNCLLIQQSLFNLSK